MEQKAINRKILIMCMIFYPTAAEEVKMCTKLMFNYVLCFFVSQSSRCLMKFVKWGVFG